ncbi:MAG: hypothetical protein PQ612_09510 [Rickettsiales bacterium]|nr:hypothetical protein [Pseudomonadota bacterium]MDA0967422.1 hypothetical protein [Pseudomonadota bacterium]MDG4544210.1 hypothetical protein [Rickettsiales bacterium]MDG4546391.1 hypothetical protein [Rickettsiales bacterium]MDG4548534.1 hypothetical protein [Rickettsiales bacterium]
MNAPSPNVGAELGAKLSSMSQGGGGGQSGITGRMFFFDTSDGQPFFKDHDYLTQMAGSVAILNFGKASIDGGLLDTVLRGIKADKETAFKTPELGAGGAMDFRPEASAPPAESSAASIAGTAASSESSSSSSDSSGDARAFPTTMGTSRGMQDMQFAGDVAMDRIGLLTPSATPGMGAAKSVGMEV